MEQNPQLSKLWPSLVVMATKKFGTGAFSDSIELPWADMRRWSHVRSPTQLAISCPLCCHDNISFQHWFLWKHVHEENFCLKIQRMQAEWETMWTIELNCINYLSSGWPLQWLYHGDVAIWRSNLPLLDRKGTLCCLFLEKCRCWPTSIFS